MPKQATLKDSATNGQLLSFLTTEEVLTYLKVTPRTIYRLIRTGELPAVRIGRQWRFRPGDLDLWLDRQRHSIKS